MGVTSVVLEHQSNITYSLYVKMAPTLLFALKQITLMELETLHKLKYRPSFARIEQAWRPMVKSC